VEEDGQKVETSSKPKKYLQMKDKLREKTLQDLAIVLFLASKDHFKLREN
jgi:hypothetical protein